ncbi:protein of unknown function DUF1080 [Fibrisoma limi BUZ 3]|uniref:3-keto-alpha-glucoside-1,2-lyase/3-keto-2-hydroxy-glucal hydratase domain-containing protein n=1 Tax=Fibrisoma limi BUZ 3 TaxID=1185876 RepID=I2GGN2_9BACT|nr:DUF1080 domain-containing protein [Fibrisoma limi]CCH53057.1 protein of unknown function DUF1080 [Fibrisoma limi BUZ 3]
MIRLFLFLLLLPALWQHATKPLPLFDGRSFQGWEGDTATTWRIVDGALVGGSLTTTVPHNNFLCTRKSYDDFQLTLQVKLEGTGFVNGGIQFRSKRAQNPAYEMIGYQADMGDKFWGCLYDESRRDKVLAGPDSTAQRRLVKTNDWNDYRLRCEGRHIQIWINGQQTVDYTEPDQNIPQTGIIGLQIHGGGKALASFRNLMLEEL